MFRNFVCLTKVPKSLGRASFGCHFPIHKKNTLSWLMVWAHPKAALPVAFDGLEAEICEQESVEGYRNVGIMDVFFFVIPRKPRPDPARTPRPAGPPPQ